MNIGSDIAGTKYDAATANWGDPWRTPTNTQCNELIDNTTSQWTTYNGVSGRAFSSKKNGHTVFFPAAGYVLANELFNIGSNGYIWTSSIFRDLRGFSETSIKRMRIFYEAWCSMFENRPLSADDLQNSIIPVGDKGHIEIRPLTTDELPPETLDAFLNHGDFC